MTERDRRPDPVVLLCLALVVAGAVTLVAGLLASGLTLIYVSIAFSVAAGGLLLFAGWRNRAHPLPASHPGTAERWSAAPARRIEPGLDVAPNGEFPIPDYEQLLAAQIVPLLTDLDDDELRAVQEREQRGTGRAIILKCIAGLLGEDAEAERPSAPGHDPAESPSSGPSPSAGGDEPDGRVIDLTGLVGRHDADQREELGQA